MIECLSQLYLVFAGGDGAQGPVDGHERAGALHEARAEVPGHHRRGRVQEVSTGYVRHLL